LGRQTKGISKTSPETTSGGPRTALVKGPPSIHRNPGLIEMQELNSGIGISLKFGPLSALYIANIIDLGLKGDFGK
jgi:hypothetical protein